MGGWVVQLDWSVRVLRALDAGLEEGGAHVVRDVHVVKGTGGTHLVTVCSAVPHDQVAAKIEEAIHSIIGDALPGRRRVVRIVWAEPT